MYPEYDPNGLSLGQAFANILRGVSDPNAWKKTGQSALETAKMIPNVAESLARGGVAQAVGTMGDLRDLRNTVQSYLPKSVQNFSNAAEFMTNPYAKALIQTAPTTEETLDFVPRATAPYEGYKQHETLGEFTAPALGYMGAKGAKQAVETFGPKAAEMTENYLRSIGGIADIVPSDPAKVAQALRQPEKNALGFYSPLDEAVMNLQNQKGTGQQYLAQLLKTQGVKQEEVATRGLDQFLESNPKVTREQMAQYLRENPVELKETVLGADTKRDLKSISNEDYELRGGDALDDPDYISSVADDLYFELKNDPTEIEHYRTKAFEDLDINPATADFDEMNEVDDLVDDYLRDAAQSRAHDQYWESPIYEHYDDIGYTVRGNDDFGYSITDPNGREVPTGRSGIYDIGDAEAAIREDAINQGLMHYADEEYGTKYHDYTLPNGENYREVLIQYPNEYKQKPFPKQAELDAVNEKLAQYKEAGNREEYGQLIGKRTELNNERTKFTKNEEYKANSQKDYQSGHFDEPNILAHFRTTDRTIDGKKTLFVEEIQSDWHQAGRKKGYSTETRKPTKEELEEWNKIDRTPFQDRTPEQRNRLEQLDEIVAQMPKGVPDAPFKKNWQELAMKRAMQMAAEGGYDRVAFTTGKQQANRYSLSKQIDSVDLIPSKEGDKPFVLQAWKDGRNVIRKAVTEDDLPDLIGKEAAQKLLAQEPKGLHRPEGVAHGNPNVFQGRELSGLDLDVGGEGMKGFYDKILPDFINKYGKKHGLKVGKTQIPTGKSRDASGIPSMYDQKEDVHYFDLTPEAKESFIKKGQPMFAAAPAIGITDEDTRREVLEKLFNSK